MFQKSTLQLLRFPFSYFLMPVFWFSISQVPFINLPKSILVFFILHLLVYPSSNGYNSYMDRDSDSIGGLKKPMQPTKELFRVTIGMDIVAVLLSFKVSTLFASCIAVYIVFSRLYSYRGIRLKQYPIIGYLVVVLNQGALTFFMVYFGCASGLINETAVPWLAMITAALLIGGFYPVTQVYQHNQDARDGVTTISMVLGIRGTFIFTAVIYVMAFVTLFFYFQHQKHLIQFMVLQFFFIPVVFYFLKWMLQVWKDENQANHTQTMRMNWIASTCTNLAFITLLIIHLN